MRPGPQADPGQFDDPGHDEGHPVRLHRQLVRLIQAALMIEPQLRDPGVVAAGSSGERLHQRLVDGELALSNIARLVSTTTTRAPCADASYQALLATAEPLWRNLGGTLDE